MKKSVVTTARGPVDEEAPFGVDVVLDTELLGVAIAIS